MKILHGIHKYAGGLSMELLVLTVIFSAFTLPLRADGPVPPPLLEVTSGLPGEQVRITWLAQAGVKYRIEKSSNLETGGPDGWHQVALVEATSADGEWRDPEPTTTKAFYRVAQPVAEVFSISPPLLSTDGGVLSVLGQYIPAGSFLVIQIPGQAPILVSLSSLGNGEWQALVSGTFEVGNEAAAVSIQDENGVTLVSLNQPLEITSTGRAVDSPGSLPPGAPVPDMSSNPIPGIGVVIKRNPGTSSALVAGGGAGKVSLSSFNYMKKANTQRINVGSITGGGGAGKATFKEFTVTKATQWSSKKGYDYYQAQSQMNSAPLLAIWASKKGYDYYQAQSQLKWARKKSYDYYKALSEMNSARLQNNPAFISSGLAGEMPAPPNIRMVRELAYARFTHAIFPAPSGLPGEVSFQFCALSLETPAGPPLQLIHTYRSKPPVSVSGGSGTAGSHWESCYDISIEPIPTTAGSSATRLLVRDGGCRADIFYRQPDGTYRCDGMFREGSFVGDTFTLTFADKGTWTFNPLSDPDAPGRIAAITDRNNVELTCIYNGSGLLERVSSQFGQTLTMTYGSDSSLSQVSDHSGRSVYYTYCGPQDPDGNEGDLKSISAPQVGSSSPFGPTTFTYLTGQTVPELNGNLLSITDGANRLLEAFTYSTQSDPTAVDFDTCATHDRHRTSDNGTGEVIGELVTLSFEPLSSGGYAIIENDELGRVTQTTFDRQHREISVREYTGFATPGAFVTSASFPLPGKLYETDPEFFETTCAYNADSSCTRITRPDGSQELTTFDRDFRRDCPVRERGNARVMTLQTASGELRTMRCDYLPNFGNHECYSPGNPIGGLTVKGGKNPGGGNIQSKVRPVTGSIDMDSDDDGFALLKKEEGGRHTPFHNKYRPQNGAVAGGITGGVVAAIVIAARSTGEDDDCDGDCDDEDEIARIAPKQKSWLCSNFRTRIVSAYGQVSTFGYDANGNCTSYTSPLPSKGQLYQYNSHGQRTTTTVLNGPGSSFTDECVYDTTTHFLSSLVSDSSGLQITTSYVRDNLGRMTKFVDPRGNEWQYSYNPLDQCIQIQSPPIPSLISTNFTIDSGGRVCRCDVEYRAPDGSLVSTNPVYSTFFVRDARCRLVQVATEERPVDSPPSALAPAPDDLASYDVCDITLDHAGQVSRVSTPAACRGQATDLACDFTYTERGKLHRCIEGGLGTAGAVTTEYAYDLLGATVRCTTVGTTPALSSQTMVSYDGFHRPTLITDPNGNVTEYAYANDGSVTTSVYGELNDVAGSAGNVLLSRATARFSSGDLGGNPNDPVCLDLPGIDMVCYDIDVKSSAFFTVETEDDTVTVERFTPGSTAPPATEVTVIDRSPAGLVQQISRNGDLLESYSYDTAGRLTGHICGQTSHLFTLNDNGDVVSCARTDTCPSDAAQTKTFTVSHVLDAAGRITQTTDGTGNTSSCTYDSLHRPVSFTEPGGLVTRCAYDGSSSGVAFSQEISADAVTPGTFVMLSRSLVRSGELRSTTDSYSHTTTFSNDALGRPVRTDFPDGTFETTGYDSLGFRATGTYSDGSTRDVTNDRLGRPITVVWSLPPAPTSIVGVPNIIYTHDGLGRCTSITQGTHVVACSYDSLGNLLSESQDGRVVSSTYNYRGRTGITKPGGPSFVEQRDGLGLLLSISALNEGVPVVPPVVEYEYAGNRIISGTQGNGIVTNYQYRGDGEESLPGATDYSFDACVKVSVSDLSITTVHRDQNQRLIRDATDFSTVATPPARSKTFIRNRLGHVTNCTTHRRPSAGFMPILESMVSYTRDLEGRRLSATSGANPGPYTQADTVPPGDQQVGQYTTWPRGSLEWDDNGNLISMATATGTLSVVHDVEGRLTSVSRNGVPVISYAYDPLGRCISRDPEVGVATTFVYDGDECIQELGEDGLADLTFVSSGGIKHCISTRNGTIYYPHGGSATNLGREPTAVIGFACTAGRETADMINLVTTATGVPEERFDCDDAGKPIILTSDGLPSTASSSSIGLRWLAPACAWEPEIAMFQCPGGLYSPDLGTGVSSHKEKPKNTKPIKASWDLIRAK